MLGTTGFYSVSAFEGERAVAEREKTGWRIFRLPIRIASKDDFFEGVRATFPLDPLLRSNHSWDALADSLWAGLDGLVDQKIVVVWEDAPPMKLHAPDEFEIAMNILRELPESFADHEMTVGMTKQFLVLCFQ